jgi:hypothetical protein
MSELAAKFPAMDQAKIPYCALTERPFEADYSPEALREQYGKWRRVKESLADGDTPVFGRRRLSQQIRERQPVYDAFLSDYTTYWTREIPAQVQISRLPEWEKALLELRSTQQWVVRKGLEDLCDSLELALDALQEAEPDSVPAAAADLRKRIDATRQNLKTRAFTDQCADVLASWTGLPQEPVDARETIMQMVPARFVQQFFVMPTGSQLEDFATTYWREMGSGLLRKLADELATEMIRKLRDANVLRKQRFPLDFPQETVKPLSPEELAEMRQLINALRPPLDAYAAGTIARGQRTGIRRIDQDLDRLVKPPVNRAEEAWLEASRRVVGTLVRDDGRPLACKVTLLPGKEIEERLRSGNNAHHVWRDVRLRQGASQTQPVRPSALTEVEVGEFKCPGEDIQIDFLLVADTGGGQANIQLKGPWGPLLMLFSGPFEGTLGERGEGVSWETAEPMPNSTAYLSRVKLIDREGAERTFLLKLDYGVELPPEAEWPSGYKH